MKNQPIGVKDFRDLINNNYYYVDKTMFIKDFMQSRAYVNLITRPHNFGKTINLSMMRYFLEIGSDKNVFNNLKIAKEKDICEKYMGQFPVIYLNFADITGTTFDEACKELAQVIGDEALRFSFVKESDELPGFIKDIYRAITMGVSIDEDVNLETSLFNLTMVLSEHYNKQVIVLIDEFDAPLSTAYQNGYYYQMASTFSRMFTKALKTNSYLNFAILTGCLHTPREDIIAGGLNNVYGNNIGDTKFSEYFGFTENEVATIISDYNLKCNIEELNQMFGGYLFGNINMYCPRDIVWYCNDVLVGNKFTNTALNQLTNTYWKSANEVDLLKYLLSRYSMRFKEGLDRLLSDDKVKEKLDLDITYDNIDERNGKNFWSALALIGYVAPTTPVYMQHDTNHLGVRIPNQEILITIRNMINELLIDDIEKDYNRVIRFCHAFLEEDGDTEYTSEIIEDYLLYSVGLDNFNKLTPLKKSFYINLLVNLFSVKVDWEIKYDEEKDYISLYLPNQDTEVIIKLGYVSDMRFLKNKDVIIEKFDESEFIKMSGHNDVVTRFEYLIVFCRRRCKVIGVVTPKQLGVPDFWYFSLEI